MTEDESDSQIVFEFRKSREARRRQHLENVQLSIAVLIIGSYFTKIGQELVSINSVGWLTTLFVSVSAFYILSKSIELTLKQFKNHRLITSIRSISYTIYTISATGYAVFLGFTVFDIQISNTEAYATILIIVIISLILGI